MKAALPALKTTRVPLVALVCLGIFFSACGRSTNSLAAGFAGITRPAPGSVLPDSPVSFEWGPGSNVNAYWLYAGRSKGTKEYYNSGETRATQTTVSNLPRDGSTVYVRLWYKVNSHWQYTDYSYATRKTETAASSPEITRPAPGSVLADSPVNFEWSPGSNVTAYWLYAGRSKGTKEYYNSGETRATQTTVSNLPRDGSTVYVRLWHKVNSRWQYTNYSYATRKTETAASSPEMARPAPDSVLADSPVNFEWSPGSNVTAYWLYAGKSPGTKEYYNSGETRATQTTVSGLPQDGSRVYVRLWHRIDSKWQFRDYAYLTAPKEGTADTTPPAVTITSPATGAAYTTAASTVTLSGTAFDRAGVTAVTCARNGASCGTVSGTTSWSISSVPLVMGKNNIIVTARDATGNTGTGTLTITRTTATTSSNQWIQIPKRTKAQKTAGIAGGEGWQQTPGMAYAPSDSNIAYMVSDTNQVWKTTNANADPYSVKWERKSNGFYANGGTSVVVDPANPDIVYVAGSQMHNDKSHIAEGIFRTTDGGNNWTMIKAAHFHRGQSRGIQLAFAGSTIYAAQSEGGLLKSTNGGTIWNLVNKSGGGYVLDNNGGMSDIKVHPTDNTTLFISTGWGLYKVMDRGGSAAVTKIGAGLPSRPYATVINHNNPDIIFAVAGTDGIYKSTNGGLNFTQTKASPVSNGKAGSARQIAMSPVNPNKVMAGFLNLWPTKQLYYTHDGGTTWKLTDTMDEKNADGWVAGSLFQGGTWTNDWSGSGEWSAPVAFHPTDENTAIIAGHGDIIRKTADGGRTWKYANTGYTGSGGTVNNPRPVAWDRINPDIMATFHADFGPMLTTDGEETFRSIANTSPGASPGGAIRNNIIVRAKGNWTNITNYVLIVSRDSGVSYTTISGTEGASNQWTNEWMTQLVSFHPQNDNIVYAGRFRFDKIGTSNNFVKLSKPVHEIFPGNGNIVYSFSGSTVYKSTDKGSTWTTPYPSLNIPSGYNVFQIAVDPLDQNRIYAAARNKGVYIITNTAANGGKVIYRGDADGITRSRYGTVDINSVAVDPNNPNVVYAGAYASWNGQSNGIFRSTDYGITWKNINGNLGADINIKGIAVNPHNSYVYISSFAGTWKLPPPDATVTADADPIALSNR
jgi:hypothetical protein